MVTAAGVPYPILTESGPLPSGVTFHDNGDGTALLAGTPAVSGSYPLTVSASNGISPDASQNLTLTIGQAPTITSVDHATFTVGATGNFMFTSGPGFPAPTWSESGSLPSKVSFTDNGDGTAILTGAPDAGMFGTYAITVTASNGIDPDATQHFTLTVDQAPTITSAASTTFIHGSGGYFLVSATGFPTPSITESGPLPSGVTFVGGVLSGVPNTNGIYPLTFTAQNGIGVDAVQTFTLTIDQAPTISSADHTTFPVGTSGRFTFTSGAGFPTPTLAEVGRLPSGVVFTSSGNGTATLSGAPAMGTAGSYVITAIASNGVLPNASQSFTLTVTPLWITTTSLPHGSVWTKSHKVVYSASLTATAGNPPYKWSLAAGSNLLPPGLRLKGLTGVITGKATMAGNYSFTIQVFDTKIRISKGHPATQDTATAQLSITITP